MTRLLSCVTFIIQGFTVRVKLAAAALLPMDHLGNVGILMRTARRAHSPGHTAEVAHLFPLVLGERNMMLCRSDQRRPAASPVLRSVKPFAAQGVGDEEFRPQVVSGLLTDMRRHRPSHQPSPALGKQLLVRQADPGHIVALVQRGVGSAIPVRAASRCAGNFFPRLSALRSIPAQAALLRK